MRKGAYFLPLYYQRLLTSTTGWKDDEFGAYLRLLIYQFDKGSIPNNMDAISRIAPSAKKNWNLIKEKFEQDSEGNMRNSVMDSIRKKQLNKSEVSRKNGTKGGRRKNLEETQQEPSGLANYNPEAKLNESNTIMVNGLLVNGYSEGGVGEDENWIWDAEKEKFFQGGDWIYKFTQEKNLTVNQFDKIAKEFIADLELKEDYKPIKEIRSHFTNWFNKKKSESKNKKTEINLPSAPPLQKL